MAKAMEMTDASIRRWVWVLCFLAALRVCFFAAVFPFFNNVDEQWHYDTVVKYSHGHHPRTLEPVTAESAEAIVRFGSPEYLRAPRQFPNGQYPPPLWTLPEEETRAYQEKVRALWTEKKNVEDSSPPLYYCVAGAWLRLGKAFGLPERSTLYWIRLMNAPVAAAVVWLGYLAARMVFPDRRWLLLGVPMLLAFLPQDSLYAIAADAMCPLCFGAAFVCLLKWWRADLPGIGFSIVTGLSLASAYLVKLAGLPLLLAGCVVLLVKAVHWMRIARLRVQAPALIALVLSLALPLIVVSVLNLATFGDLTGGNIKALHMTLTPKPWIKWFLPHPLFTASGFWEFATDLLSTFWRGELCWHGETLHYRAMDVFYFGSSMALLCLAGAALLRTSTSDGPFQRGALTFAFASFMSSVAFLFLLSLMFDYGNCYAPSAARPFWSSGRLISGAMIPFVLLYVFGLDRALSWTKTQRARLLVLVAIVVLVTTSEIILTIPVFSSEYNWFAK